MKNMWLWAALGAGVVYFAGRKAGASAPVPEQQAAVATAKVALALQEKGYQNILTQTPRMGEGGQVCVPYSHSGGSGTMCVSV
jgi:hypothetical protein